MKMVLTDVQVYAEHIMAIITLDKYIWSEVILVETAWLDIKGITLEIKKQ